jgi:hypothetical protein
MRDMIAPLTQFTCLDSKGQKVLFGMVDDLDMCPAVQTFMETREVQRVLEGVEGHEDDFDTDSEHAEMGAQRSKIEMSVSVAHQLARERDLTKTLMQKNLALEEELARL